MKPKHFTIPIPIYEWDVIVSHQEKDNVLFRRIEKLGFKREDFESDLASDKSEYGFTVKLPQNTIVIRINNYNNKTQLFTTITHEGRHAADYILTHIGTKFVMNVSDEPFTYLQDYICGIIFKKLGC